MSGLGSEIQSLRLWGGTYRGVGGPEEIQYPLTSTPPLKVASSRRQDRLEVKGGEVHCLNVSRCSWVSAIELRYQFWCMHIVPRLPRVVFNSEVFPLYEVAEFPVNHFAVQDLFHHPFLFSVDNLRERLRGCTPSGYWIFWCRSKFYHVEMLDLR